MRVLFLGYSDCDLLNFLKDRCDVRQTEEKISLESIIAYAPDIIISYGYRNIIAKDVIDHFSGRILNLHISYLPWNRGVFPNIWSIIDDTPKGVTIHMIDEGIDTGDIIFQKIIALSEDDTLSSSYQKLRENVENLFIDNWEKIKQLDFERKKQEPGGTFHLKKTSIRYFKKLGILNNWEIKVGDLKVITDEDIINEIRDIRAKNNDHWMDVVKLAFRVSPTEARDIFKKIKYCDFKINELLKELAENDKKQERVVSQ
jgi:methionyl-tRNA formyltransferase